MKSKFLVILFCCPLLWCQNYPTNYYNVIYKDSLYIFTSNNYILLFLKEGLSQPFELKSVISGQYSISTQLAISESRLLVNNNDTLTLYDISKNPPELVCNQYLGFPITRLYTYGPY